MSGPLPQYRASTKATDVQKVKVAKDGTETPVTRLVVDKTLPPRKGERPTYTHKEVPVYRHKIVPKPAPRGKHTNGRVMSSAAYKAHVAFVARIQKKVKKALAWMQANDKGWDAAVAEGLIPAEVVEKMGVGGQAS